MASRLSRRKLAIHAANRLLEGDESVIDELAALLIAERREREADTLVRDIEDQLGFSGELVVTVETAHKIDETIRQQVFQLFPDKTVHIREVIKPELIGGFRVTTPERVLDATLASKLSALRAMKV
ncbi:hypothetical protein B7Y94_01535 [Candidatus Saccharibacteria bacterium 32-49-12]|nr:MAG: hypothetical protein B7Y94_01535 [Candidatus Saccharibacteria bacterium 32-49-12]